jgi:hypothetical protein
VLYVCVQAVAGWVPGVRAYVRECASKRVELMVNVLAALDTNGGVGWLLDLSSLQLTVRRVVMLLTELWPETVLRLAGRVYGHGPVFRTSLGMLVAASLYLRKDVGISAASHLSAVQHVFTSGLKASPRERACAMACIGNMLRAEPTCWQRQDAQQWFTAAKDTILGVFQATTNGEEYMATPEEIFGASCLLKALARAWKGHGGDAAQHGVVCHDWWWALLCGLVGWLLNQKTLMTETEVRRTDLLEALAVDLPPTLTLPILHTLAGDVMERMRDEGGSRREVAVRLFIMLHLLKGADNHIQGNEAFRTTLGQVARDVGQPPSPEPLPRPWLPDTPPACRRQLHRCGGALAPARVFGGPAGHACAAAARLPGDVC